MSNAVSVSCGSSWPAVTKNTLLPSAWLRGTPIRCRLSRRRSATRSRRSSSRSCRARWARTRTRSPCRFRREHEVVGAVEEQPAVVGEVARLEERSEALRGPAGNVAREPVSPSSTPCAGRRASPSPSPEISVSSTLRARAASDRMRRSAARRLASHRGRPPRRARRWSDVGVVIARQARART